MSNKHPILNICGYAEFYDGSDIEHHVDDYTVKIASSFCSHPVGVVWTNIALLVCDQVEEYLDDPYQSP